MKRLLAATSIFVFALSAFAQNQVTRDQSSVAMTDGQIARILITINKGEIDAGQLAMQKSKNPDVQAFAKMMVNDHMMNLTATQGVASNNSIALEDSKMSQDLVADADKTKMNLEKASNFDKSYVDAQVSGHQKAFDTLKSVLIPNAQNAKLKAHLQKTKDAVKMHLEHAKDLQKKIK